MKTRMLRALAVLHGRIAAHPHPRSPSPGGRGVRSVLLPLGEGWDELWRGGAGCYLLAALLLLPVWAEPTLKLPGKVQDTLFVLDISESMNVPDVEYPAPRMPRLELAKAAVRESMAALNCGSRVSVALFAGEDAVVLFEPLEICRHFPAIEQVVSRISTRMRWIGDSRIEAGLTHAINEAMARKLNVVFISDGDEMPHRSSPRITGLESLRGKVRGAVFVVGGDVPLPVPRLDGNDQVTSYWTPEEAVREGYHPNLLSVVELLAAGEKAPAGVLDEVGEHMSAASPGYMEILASAAGLEFRRLRKPGETAAIVSGATLTREALADRDARWIFGLLACLLALTGWFWPELSGILLELRKSIWRTTRLN